MAIVDASLNEERQLIEVSDLLRAPAHMAGRAEALALTIAGVALPLELLHKARPKSLGLRHHALAIATLAHVHVVFTVGAAPAAVRTDAHLKVCDLNALRPGDLLLGARGRCRCLRGTLVSSFSRWAPPALTASA